MTNVEKRTSELQDETIFHRRVSRTTKGGRTASFAVLVVSGDGAGRVGFGYGKAKEQGLAVQKATEASRKNLKRFDLRKQTIFHPVSAKYGATKIFMHPASQGTGIIAGGAMRTLLEVLGVKDVFAKIQGSSNPLNVVRATMVALSSMDTPSSIAKERGKSCMDIFSSPAKPV